jgi:hypothetical protein
VKIITKKIPETIKKVFKNGIMETIIATPAG